jgi:DNA-dependent RNA polymerase auxiliary subunit epsilon
MTKRAKLNAITNMTVCELNAMFLTTEQLREHAMNLYVEIKAIAKPIEKLNGQNYYILQYADVLQKAVLTNMVKNNII